MDSSQLTFLFTLLVMFQVKHYFADYPLQTEYMLGKFRETGWVLPLGAHAGVHALLTFLISGMFVSFFLAVLLALFDFVAHFSMDRIKASPNLLGRYNDSREKAYWNVLGLDQLFHHLTHYTIIANIFLYYFR